MNACENQCLPWMNWFDLLPIFPYILYMPISKSSLFSNYIFLYSSSMLSILKYFFLCRRQLITSATHHFDSPQDYSLPNFRFPLSDRQPRLDRRGHFRLMCLCCLCDVIDVNPTTIGCFVRMSRGVESLMFFDLQALLLLLSWNYWRPSCQWPTNELWLLEDLINVSSFLTWSRVFPCTSIPFTSNTSSFTASRPVDSARPPGTSRDIKIPGCFSIPFVVTFTDVPSRM